MFKTKRPWQFVRQLTKCLLIQNGYLQDFGGMIFAVNLRLREVQTQNRFASLFVWPNK
jgi:hypothetical protein